MKFLETISGMFINVDEIRHIGCECCEFDSDNNSDRDLSYVYLKNGDKTDFLETVDTFELPDGTEIRFDYDCLISLTREAVKYLSYIINRTDIHFIRMQEVETEAWKYFEIEFEEKVKEAADE